MQHSVRIRTVVLYKDIQCAYGQSQRSTATRAVLSFKRLTNLTERGAGRDMQTFSSARRTETIPAKCVARRLANWLPIFPPRRKSTAQKMLQISAEFSHAWTSARIILCAHSALRAPNSLIPMIVKVGIDRRHSVRAALWASRKRAPLLCRPPAEAEGLARARDRFLDTPIRPRGGQPWVEEILVHIDADIIMLTSIGCSKFPRFDII